MKRLIHIRINILVLTLSMMLAGSAQLRAESDSLISHDSMNLAVIEMDYLTHDLLNISMMHYPLCNCDQDSLPFYGEYMPPMDFGDMKFRYMHDNSLLFGGTLVWMGQGFIYHPVNFEPGSMYTHLQDSVPLPSNAQYLYWWTFPGGTYADFTAKSQAVWKTISDLKLVHEFAEGHHMRVGFYGYAPTQGMMNPVVARWIIFVYRGNDITMDIPDQTTTEKTLNLWPNPASTTLSVDLRNFDTPQHLIITDMTGQTIKTILQTGNRIEKLDIADLPAGIYTLQLVNKQGFRILKKFTKI
jgi:hypothetical protein